MPQCKYLHADLANFTIDNFSHEQVIRDRPRLSNVGEECSQIRFWVILIGLESLIDCERWYVKDNLPFSFREILW
jgi:hypothetical protein